MNQEEMMDVLVVEPGQPPYVKAIQTGLESLYREIDTDTVQAVYPWNDPVGLICDENGKMTGKELNRALRDEDGHIYDVVAGTFLIAGLSEEDFTSLTQEQIDKFKDVFKTPEAFINLGGRLMVVPLEERRPSVKDKLTAMKETEKPHIAPAKKHDREVR